MMCNIEFVVYDYMTVFHHHKYGKEGKRKKKDARVKP